MKQRIPLVCPDCGNPATIVTERLDRDGRPVCMCARCWTTEQFKSPVVARDAVQR